MYIQLSECMFARIALSVCYTHMYYRRGISSAHLSFTALPGGSLSMPANLCGMNHTQLFYVTNAFASWQPDVYYVFIVTASLLFLFVVEGTHAYPHAC